MTAVFWATVQCNVVDTDDVSQKLAASIIKTINDDVNSKLLRNVGECIQYYNVEHSRGQPSSRRTCDYFN